MCLFFKIDFSLESLQIFSVSHHYIPNIYLNEWVSFVDITNVKSKL